MNSPPFNHEIVLAQARSHGLGCILAHQSMSQLNPPGGIDLRELVMSCTTVKRGFDARDPWLLQYVSNTSGTTKYYRRSYSVAPHDLLRGAVGPQFACPDRDGQRRVNIQEYTSPRLTYQDVLNFSRQPNVSLLWIDHAKGLSQFRGWFPVHTNWPIDEQTHRQYQQEPWPETTQETIEMKSIWPTDNPETITPTSHPDVALDQEQIDVSDKLKKMKRILEQR